MKTLGDAVNLFTCCIFTLNAFTIVLPAFLIAGALVVFIPSQSVMKYLGARANRILSYGVAALSGNVLTVCSCNVVPIFSSILTRGAGIGPAFCFVFAAPAIHIVNTIFTYQVIGLKLALWRFITVPIVAILVGLGMALLFHREERDRQQRIHENKHVALLERTHEETKRGELLLLMLIGVLFFGAWLALDGAIIQFAGQLGLSGWLLENSGKIVRLLGTVIALGALGKLCLVWFGREETAEWRMQTWMLLRMIVPIFVVAVFVIALIVQQIPISWIMPTAAQTGGIQFGYPQGNGIISVFLAALFGTIMYFPMLTEVAFTKGLLLERFAVGPALAILLAGPGMSLPGLLLVRKVAGMKRMLAYWALTLILVTIVSFLFGRHYGEYLCSCQLQQGAKPVQTVATPSSFLGVAWYVVLMTWIITTIKRAKKGSAEAAA